MTGKLWDRGDVFVLAGILAYKMPVLFCTVQLKGATKPIMDWFGCNVSSDIQILHGFRAFLSEQFDGYL